MDRKVTWLRLGGEGIEGGLILEVFLQRNSNSDLKSHKPSSRKHGKEDFLSSDMIKAAFQGQSVWEPREGWIVEGREGR